MVRSLIPILLCVVVPAHAHELASFSVADRLGQSWTNELVHEDLQLPRGAPAALELVDDAGHKLPLQLSGTRAWTVLSLAPGSRRRLSVRAATTPQKTQPAATTVTESKNTIVIDNGLVRVELPRYSSCESLSSCPTPIASMSPSGPSAEAWRASWHITGAAPSVRAASSEILERGPVRVRVRQRLTFTNNRAYVVELTLIAGQTAALINEDGFVPGNVALRLMAPDSDRMVWMNQGADSALAKRWTPVITSLDGNAGKLIELRPFSFWWLPDLSEWLGLYHSGSSTELGLVALRPSHWSPTRWEGFAQSALIVTKSERTAAIDLPLFDGKERLHREWALTVDDLPKEADAHARAEPLRHHLLRQSEAPLDEVLRWPLDLGDRGPHPRLLITADGLRRARNAATRSPLVEAQLEPARAYLRRCGSLAKNLERDGAAAFYQHHWIDNRLENSLPTVFLTDDDPVYGKMLAAAALGISNDLRRDFLGSLDRPALSAWGPWITAEILRLAIYHDLLLGTGALTAEQARDIRATLVLCSRAIASEDYWSPARGLASANPNMTSSIVLARGVLALYLDGDPAAPAAIAAAETELDRELHDWVSPGGAWVEAPGYQAVSMESMLVFAAALKNHGGRDFFVDPRLRATMDYYGSLLTPPDSRFANGPIKGLGAPATLPSIGDTFSGWITGLNGWLAAATATSQPAFSRVQQFYFNAQRQFLGGASLVGPLLVALVDTSLPSQPPSRLSASFPGFGAVMRHSFTDPRTIYVAHRTGSNIHHYHDDANSIVLHAKGAALCTDFGNLYQPVQRDEAWYHNRVSFGDASTPRVGSHGEPGAFVSLPGIVDFSTGTTIGGGNQRDDRHVLLVHADDAMGPSYVVLRDHATGAPTQPFFWNLWCLADRITADGRAAPSAAQRPVSLPLGAQNEHVLTFVGQSGIDLDVTLLSPAHPIAQADQWEWKQDIYIWHQFSERQVGVHLRKDGPQADFFAVLWPRPDGERGARVSSFSDGNVARVEYDGGVDFVADGEAPVSFTRGDVSIQARVAFVRRARAEQRLALADGAGTVAAAGWSLSGDAPAAAIIHATELRALIAGAPRTIVIRAPPGLAPRLHASDGISLSVQEREWRLKVAAGEHSVAITWQREK